jgi:phospholipid/cholesterol/gamma-HCH transport system ATP-binding protein
VVLFDEPTQGLDPPHARLISDLIAEVRGRLEVTSIIVSHDLRTIFTLCNRVALLADGQIVETGSPSELADSANPMVRDFVRGHPPEEPFDPRISKPPEPWPESAARA